MNRENNEDPIFGKTIFTYTSAEAVEDGVLVAVTKRDCVTRSVWDHLVSKVPSAPPDFWPVELMGFCRAKNADDKVLAMTRALIASESAQAIAKDNAGGMFEIHTIESVNEIKGIAREAHPSGRTMWLRPNEVGGVTLMFPEDN